MWFVYLALLLVRLDASFAAFSCPASFGLFTDPGSCANYFECENFMPTSKVCGPGLFFNEKMKICDWPASVDQSRCSGSSANNGLTSNNVPSITNQPDYSNLHHSNHIAFRCYEDGLFEDPVSCSHFVECNGLSPYRKMCPSGLHFDIRIKACNWPESMECSKFARPATTQRPPIGRPNTGKPTRPPANRPPANRPPPNRPPPNRPTNRPPFTTETPEPTGYPTPPYDPERDNMNFKPERQTRPPITSRPTGGSSSCEWCFKCPDREDKYYENNYDRYTYYHCFEGEPYLLYCPRNNVWIQSKKICQSEKMNEAFNDKDEGGSSDGAGLIDARMKTRKPTAQPTTGKPKRNQSS